MYASCFTRRGRGSSRTRGREAEDKEQRGYGE
jgi:hypothetical protein